MLCVSCESPNLSVYPSEINIHHPGMQGLDQPTVWAFPRLTVCLNCGFTQFTLEGDQLCELNGSDFRSAAAAD